MTVDDPWTVRVTDPGLYGRDHDEPEDWQIDPDGTPEDDDYERTIRHQQLVADEAQRLRIRRDATRLLALEEAAAEPVTPFDADLLADMLKRPKPPPMRIGSLAPSDGGLLLVAQRKAGKTTWALNCARALLTGEDFLGRFPVIPLADGHRVGFLNFEVSGDQLARWAHDIGVPPDRLYQVNLRGRRNPLKHPTDRAELAQELRRHQVEALVVDVFGRAYTGLSQNDPGEVGAWLTDLDVFARAEVGARDLILTAHAGWNGERVRGASALEDWADSIVTLVRDQNDDDAPVYMRAIGRDVDLDEDALTFDARTRTLTLSGAGSRTKAKQARKIDTLMGAVVDVLTETPGLSVADIDRALADRDIARQKGDTSKATAELVRRGVLLVEAGKRGAKVHTIRPTPTHPDHPQRGGSPPTPTPPYRSGVGDGVPQTLQTDELPGVGQHHCTECGSPVTDDPEATECRSHRGAAA